MAAQALDESATYQWKSRRMGLAVRVPLHFDLLDANEEPEAILIPGWETAAVFYDKWGEFPPSDMHHQADSQVMDVMPRTITIAVQPNDAGLDARQFCRRTIHGILHHQSVGEIDGSTNLSSISVGAKASPSFTIGGRPTFMFSYSFSLAHCGKDWRGDTLIGCVDHATQRLVLISVGCRSPDIYPSLPHYVSELLLTLLGPPSGLTCWLPEEEAPSESQDRQYDASASLANDRWQRGEVVYRNAGIAFAFSLPAYAMSLALGKSQIQAAPATALFALTITVRLPPVGGGGEEVGLQSSSQPAEIHLGIDVEDVIRARGPRILSTAEYGMLRIKSVMQEFTNTKPSGTPLTNVVGDRCGVSYLWTGNLAGAMSSRFCKVLCCVTLNSSKGFVVSYFTRTGQGLFDMNLHVLQDLLKDIYFIPEREADGLFSGEEATTVRLQTNEDFSQAFEKDAGKANLLQRYVFLAKTSTGGVVHDPASGRHFFPSNEGIVQDDDGTASVSHIGAEGRRGRKAKRGADRSGTSSLAGSDAESVIDVSDIPRFAEPEQPPGLEEERGAADQPCDPCEASPSVSAAGEAEGGRGGTPPDSPGAHSRQVSVMEGADSPRHSLKSGSSPRDLGEETVRSSNSHVSSPSHSKMGDSTVMSLAQIYARNCGQRGAKPNSRLLAVLPDTAQVSASETLDLSLNYFGSFFDTALFLFRFFPRAKAVILEGMSLTNSDVSLLANACPQLPNLELLSLRDNPDVSLAASKPLLRLVKTTPQLRELRLEGTSLGKDVVSLLQAELDYNIESRQDTPGEAEAGEVETAQP